MSITTTDKLTALLERENPDAPFFMYHDSIKQIISELGEDVNGGSSRFAHAMAELNFQETVGLGTYTASIDVPAGCIVSHVVQYGLGEMVGDHLNLDMGDTLSGPQSYFAGIQPVAPGDGLYDPANPGVNGENWVTPQGAGGVASYSFTPFTGSLALDVATGIVYENADGPGIRYENADTITAVLSGSDGGNGRLLICVFGFGVPGGRVEAVKS